jgi:uncharacterized protein
MTIPSRISLVTLGVTDLVASTAFYRSLGWQRAAASNEAITFFITADSVLGLFPYDELADDANLPADERSSFGGVTLAICLESESAVDVALADAVAAGGTLLKPAVRADWGGYSGYFADLDGHPWEIAHNPGFTLGPDGSLDLPGAQD